MRKYADEKLLNSLCDLYGSDKGSLQQNSMFYSHPPHSYNKIYASLFSEIKNNNLVIFECGLGTNNPDLPSSMGINGQPGASLRVWKDYFINSKIYGADIDTDILFSEDRIVTDYMDQTNPDSVNAFWEKHNIEPDIIIDDGLHEYNAGTTLFENSFDKLKSGGVYIIEDIIKEDIEKYKKYFNDKYSACDVMMLFMNREMSDWTGPREDNVLIVVFKP
jgi:hypothetical protein